VPTLRSVVTLEGQMRSRPLFIGFVVVAVLVCVRLGLWQLARHSTRGAANGIAATSRAGEPRVFPGGGPLAPDLRVVATGSFDLEHEFILRGRSLSGAPGVEIATPFRMAGSDTAFLVVRGFVPSSDAMSVDRTGLREEGVRTIRGVAFNILNDGTPIARNNDTTWDRIPGAWLELPGNFPYPVHAYGLWQEKEEGMPPFPIRLGPPALTAGPHLSYAIQWFAFALIFGVGGFVYLRRRPLPPTPSP
jgi:surfeit locus 1 family protein